MVCYGKWHCRCLCCPSASESFSVAVLAFGYFGKFVIWFMIMTIECSCHQFCDVSAVTYCWCWFSSILFSEPDWVKGPLNKQQKKKRTRSSVSTQCTYIGLGARGWGGTVCWGAPAICSPSQASNKSPSLQAGQPARRFPERGRGAVTEGWRLCVQACVCVFMVETCCKLTWLNEEMVAVATLWYTYGFFSPHHPN